MFFFFQVTFCHTKHAKRSNTNNTLALKDIKICGSSCIYYRSNTIKTPASGAGNVSEPMLVSQGGRLREVVCA